MSATVAGTTFRPTPSYTTLRDTTLAELAGATRRSNDEVSATVDRWPNLLYDDQGAVVAFSGLSLTPTAHRMKVAGRQLFTWCAWDTPFLPSLLGAPPRSKSTCPLTGIAVRLSVDADGLCDAHPAELWVSLPPVARISTTDVIGSFCCDANFLVGEHRRTLARPA